MQAHVQIHQVWVRGTFGAGFARRPMWDFTAAHTLVLVLWASFGGGTGVTSAAAVAAFPSRLQKELRQQPSAMSMAATLFTTGAIMQHCGITARITHGSV